jgi:hypothetical protein
MAEDTNDFTICGRMKKLSIQELSEDFLPLLLSEVIAKAIKE